MEEVPSEAASSVLWMTPPAMAEEAGVQANCHHVACWSKEHEQVSLTDSSHRMLTL